MKRFFWILCVVMAVLLPINSIAECLDEDDVIVMSEPVEESVSEDEDFILGGEYEADSNSDEEIYIEEESVPVDYSLFESDVLTAQAAQCGYEWDGAYWTNSHGYSGRYHYSCWDTEHEEKFRSTGDDEHEVYITHRCWTSRVDSNYYYYEYCDQVLSTEKCSPVPIEGFPATCTTAGRTDGSKCAFCGRILVEQEAIIMKGHTRVVDQYLAPTCTEDGHTVGAHCSECGEVLMEYEVLPATGHTIVVDEAIAPTCTETGLTEGKHCSVCNAIIVEQQVIPALGHTKVVDSEAVAPTCTETGFSEAAHCSVCNAVLSTREVVPAAGHSIVIQPAVEAKCTTSGSTEGRYCSVCGEVFAAVETVPALGHSPVTDEAIPATCLESGLSKGSHCSACGEVFVAQKTVPARGHTRVVDIEATPATCTAVGCTEEAHCSACNAILAFSEEIPALGHSWDDPVYTWADDNKTVTATHICTRDDSHVETETVKVTSKVTVNPTCTAKGETTYTSGSFKNSAFSVQTKKQQDVDALGHSWGEPVYTWSDDNKTVTAKHSCTHDDSHVETETVATTSKITVDPTCTAKGIETFTSAAFENIAFSVQTKKVDISAIGHSWGKPTYTWSDDNKTVTAKRVCNHDDSHVETETVEVTSKVTVDPTCTENGETTYTSANFENNAFAVQTKKLKDVTAIGHSWSEPVYTWSDDNKTVTAKRTCAHDGNHVETETVRTISEIVLDSTCTVKGKTKYTVSFSNAAFSKQDKTVEDIPLKNHTAVVDKGVAATCTSAGKTEGSHCSVCNAVLKAQEVIPAKGHTVVVDKAVPATCTIAGKTEGSHCSVCKAVLKTQQSIPAKGHTIVIDKAVAATYTATGKTQGTHCSVCKTVLVAQKVIPKLDCTFHVQKKTKKTVNVGDPIQIVYDGKVIKTCTSSKKKVATVTKTGYVTTKMAGKTKITVKPTKGKKITITLTVVDPYAPKSISIRQGKALTLKKGDRIALTTLLNPTNAKTTLKWKSSKGKIASVDKNGVITAKKKGSTTITVSTKNGKKAKIVIRVVG